MVQRVMKSSRKISLSPQDLELLQYQIKTQLYESSSTCVQLLAHEWFCKERWFAHNARLRPHEISKIYFSNIVCYFGLSFGLHLLSSSHRYVSTADLTVTG